MYQPDDLLRTNRNYILLIGCLTTIFSVVLLSFLVSYIFKPEIKEQVAVTPETTIPQADLTRYQQDSDKDLIPNFVEEEAILNTYVPEVSYCEQSNPICSKGPIDTNFYISVIVDSSTSMNIPAQGNLNKIDLVKRELTNLLNYSLKESFLKLQIIGLGNKGNLSFIADNESCVSNYNFKDFNQVLKGEDTNPLVLKNLFPNGKSPIEFTLNQVEKSFPEKNGRNLVIIIADGIDDCGGDLTASIRQVLSRGVVKRVNLISVYSPQDENQKLRESVESNGGSFTSSSQIFETIKDWEKDFILSNWCKSQDQNKIYQCLDKNYNKAFNILDQQLKTDTPKNEVEKIKEIKSSIGLLIRNYKSSKNESLTKDLENYFRER